VNVTRVAVAGGVAVLGGVATVVVARRLMNLTPREAKLFFVSGMFGSYAITRTVQAFIPDPAVQGNLPSGQ
jgi:hypothetical protein